MSDRRTYDEVIIVNPYDPSRPHQGRSLAGFAEAVEFGLGESPAMYPPYPPYGPRPSMFRRMQAMMPSFPPPGPFGPPPGMQPGMPPGMPPGMQPGMPPPGFAPPPDPGFGPPPGMGYYGEDPYGEYGELEPVGYYAEAPELFGWHGYGEDPYGEYADYAGYAEPADFGYYGDPTYLGAYSGYGRYVSHRPSRFNPSCLVSTNLNGYGAMDYYAEPDAYGETDYGETDYGAYAESDYGETDYGESDFSEAADFSNADAYGESPDLGAYVDPPTVSPRVTSFTPPSPAPSSTTPDPFRPLF